MTISTTQDLNGRIWNKIIGNGEMYGFDTSKGLYDAVTRLCSNEVHFITTGSVDLWPQRLGYMSNKVLQKSAQYVNGINNGSLDIVGECKVYAFGKSTRKPRNAMLFEDCGAAKPLETVFSDLAGPMKHSSIWKSLYIVTLLDPYSGYPLVRFFGAKKWNRWCSSLNGTWIRIPDEWKFAMSDEHQP